MSKGYRDGAFALGIVVGGGIVLNLFLWLSYAARHKIESHGPSNQNTQSDQDAAFWWWRWTGDLVSSSDTLAQWIMAFFTIGATVVLVFTLRSANRTNVAAITASGAALEANQILRDEQRPWLHVEIDEITEYMVQYHDVDRTDFATGIYFNVPFKIRNTGTSPAHNVSVSIVAHSIQDAYKDVEQFKFGEAPIFINQKGSLAPNTAISDEEGVTRKLTVAHEGPTDGFYCFLVAIISYSTSQQAEIPDARTVQNFRMISDVGDERSATVSFKKTKAQIGSFVVNSMGGGAMT